MAYTLTKSILEKPELKAQLAEIDRKYARKKSSRGGMGSVTGEDALINDAPRIWKSIKKHSTLEQQMEHWRTRDQAKNDIINAMKGDPYFGNLVKTVPEKKYYTPLTTLAWNERVKKVKPYISVSRPGKENYVRAYGKTWEPSETTVLINARRSGESFPSIARRLGRTPSSVSTKYYRATK